MTLKKEGILEIGGGKLKKVLAASALAAILSIPILAAPAPAQNAGGTGTIEAFIGSNLVNVQGYAPNTDVTIQVIRKGIVIGAVTGPTDGDGFAEFNHAGGGPVSEGGDCFAGSSTPDIQPGDTIRTLQGGVANSAVVRDVGINFDKISTNVKEGKITVSGHARSRANAELVPGSDVLELRLNKGSADRWDTGPGLDQDRPGRKDLRVDIGANVKPNGNFTRVLNVGRQDARDWKNNPGEAGLEWSAAAPAGEGQEVNPPSIFVADEAGGEAILGCPPLAEYGVNGSNPKVVNKKFIAGNKPFNVRGASFNARAVNVTLNDRSAATAPVTKTVKLDPAAGAQRWNAAFTNAEVGRLKDGKLTARATYTVEGQNAGGADATATFTGKNLQVLKDTVAPKKPSVNPKPGVYQRAISAKLRAQRGAKIHYTVDGRRPTANNRVYVRPIRVTGTQRIKAIAVDRAGNSSAIGSFRYVIR